MRENICNTGNKKWMENWGWGWEQVFIHSGVHAQARPPTSQSIFTSSFQLSFLPLPTTLITSGLKRTTVKCWNSLDRKVSSRSGEGRDSKPGVPRCLPALCCHPRCPPFLSSLALLSLSTTGCREVPTGLAGTSQPLPSDGLHKYSLLYKGASCLEACPRPLFSVLWILGQLFPDQ